MDIQVLQAHDAAEYRALRTKALREEPFAFGMDYESFAARTEEDIRSQIPPVDDQSFTMGAFIDGKLVGTAALFRHKLIKFRHGSDLVAMYVDESARGKGVGRALVTAVIDRARSFNGLEMISLTATHTQTVAIQMYQNAGFEMWGKSSKTMKVGDEYADFVHMTLRL